MLSAVYIKGFKTFARPVRMPLEEGVTAIVGPNGSGKSNVTDAVLFALGEQSPGVLRATTMGDVIFSGSETLPAAGAAEVTLVFDNESGEISLPYREVAITRRVSRTGEMEYRINGSPARLSDVRAVAGEAGIGRHSILRQGAVDAIVAGGAAACRQALEEAAGLGVYRRRRLAASRRLERADAQLEKSRQLESELADQLRRIEREAEAAREYRELEARYRALSLAHLYRVATGGLDDLRLRLKTEGSQLSELSAHEEALRREESDGEPRIRQLESALHACERDLEELEDGLESLRVEALRAERALFRAEARGDREGERARLVSRLESAHRRASRVLEEIHKGAAELEQERYEGRKKLDRLRKEASLAHHTHAEAEGKRVRLRRELEGLRLRRDRALIEAGGPPPTSEEDLEAISEAIEGLKRLAGAVPLRGFEDLRGRLGEGSGQLEARNAGASRRRGALETAVEKTKSRIRALRGPGESSGGGPRLYDVVRALPGFETAVEAALAEFGAGLLAENVDEGIKLLSSTERVAVRLDAQELEEKGEPPGRPLLECVEVADDRYSEAVERLLGGIYVADRPYKNPPADGHVVVTRDGLRLTRTSVSLRWGEGGFTREVRLAAEVSRLEALQTGPGETLDELRRRLSVAADHLRRTAGAAEATRDLVLRVRRTATLVVREAERRREGVLNLRRASVKGTQTAQRLAREASAVEAALADAEGVAPVAKERLDGAERAAASAHGDLMELDRRLSRVRGEAEEVRARRERIRAERDRMKDAVRDGAHKASLLAGRAAEASRALEAAIRDRRSGIRARRTAAADAYRRASEERTALARRAVELAGRLAAARAVVDRTRDELERAQKAADAAAEEISAEWGATLEDARRAAEREPRDVADERQRLVRRLKRFGDVNLLALSQEGQLRQRHEFVCAQRADAEEAADELGRMIRGIDREIESRFSRTFHRVRAAFAQMVPKMMVGAEGILELSEEGVEIGLRLGRRGWKPLRVLSGGERALLALSFLFGIFLSGSGGPSGPFCVLDEAEAALDDINLARFLAVVDSHRKNGQFLLVTHQKRTMASADVLYGITQDATGATVVVSKRMRGD